MKNKTRLKLLREFIDESDDETFLAGMMEMLRRAELHHELISTDEDDEEDNILTHEVLYVKSGSKMFLSTPQPLPFALTMIPLPKEILN